MKKIVIILFLFLSSEVFAADYSGAVPSGCYRTKWQSKYSTDTSMTCAAGHALNSIAFKHRGGENGTHQESFQFLCCQNTNVVDSIGWENDFHSNWSLETYSQFNNYGLMKGIRFKHRAGENGTHQQEYRLAFSSVKKQLSACFWIPFQSKWNLETEFSCPSSTSMNGIGFKHSIHHNGTHEESVSVKCCI